MDLVTCPTAKQIDLLLRGQIAGPLAVDLTKHIESCSRCSQSVAALGEGGQSDATGPPGLADIDGTVAVTEYSQSPVWADWNSEAGQSQPLAFLTPGKSEGEIGWLAHYRVLKVLGEGGMGMVLLAEDTQLTRAVALKVMKPEVSAYEDSRQRFMREARTMAQVKSDHVVTVHQVGEFNDTCYIAMELLEGEPLDSLLDRMTRPSLSEALRIGREIALALVAAHSHGLIHRDIKPENVWLEAPNGRVKLLDFGLARPQETSDKLTVSGMVMGTPSYMSPEQARADSLDERTDLFSLGCLLYQLLSGRIPFRRATIMATLTALIEQTPPPPSSFNPEIPRVLDELILHLLAKKPADRLQSAVELVGQIEVIEAIGVQTAGSPVEWSRQPSLPGSNLSQRHRGREAERRQVNVLVCSCDLFQSEEYLEQLDVEDQAKLLSAFHDSCRQAVQQFGGTVVQCNEESFLACFGYPIASEDSAVLAAKSALALLEALVVLAGQILSEHKIELGPRLGIHTGPAIVETKENDVSLIGEARNVAMRLKDLASCGQIICSDSAHRLLRGNFDFADLGQHKIKGLTQQIQLFQVRGAIEEGATIEAAWSIELAPLIGRDQEISLLKDRWEQAQDGMGQVVLLIGEAGLGKSRLVQAMKHHVRDAALGVGKDSAPSSGPNSKGPAGQDPPIIEWYGSPHFKNTGLYPVSRFFERLLHFERDQEPAAQFERLVRHLEKYDLALPNVVPLFASLLSLPTDSRFPSLAYSPVREREEIFGVLKDWLRAYASRQPVLFIVEDLHWLDASSVEFLQQFLTEAVHERILNLFTFRPEFSTPWPALSYQTSLPLNRLTKRQAGDLICKTTGSQLPQVVIDQVYDRTGGVPLFVEEFTKMLQESGMIEQAGQSSTSFKTLMTRTIPTTLQDLIMVRLDRLDGDPEVAQLAATLGREFTYELLSAVAGPDDSKLESELAKLVQAEILLERGRPPRSTYVFKQALVEDALYNALIKDKRRQFHARIAQALEERFPQTVETRPELLAHHFAEAGLIQQSIGYWHSAGLRSQEQFANVEAISHFTTGLALLATLPESPDRDLNELLLLNPLGSAYQAALGYAAHEVGPTFARARQLCEKIGRSGQLFAVIWGNWTWHLVRGDLKLCMGLADEMMKVAEDAKDPNDRGIDMEARVAPAVTLFYRGDFAACRKYCEEAIEQYEDLEQCRIWSGKTGQNAAVVSRCYLSLALWHLGYPDRALELNEEMIVLARQIDHPFSLAHGLHFSSWLNQYCRLGDKLRSAAMEEAAIATDQGFALWRATGTFLNGAGMSLQGEHIGALPLLEKSLQAFRAIDAALTVPGQLGVLAEAYTKAGRLMEARKAIDDGLALAEKQDDRSHEAELHRLKGELSLWEEGGQSVATAESCFRQAIAIAQGQQSKAWELRATVSLARLLQQQGREGQAQAALATIYGAFTEGFETPDLVDARELLQLLKEDK